MPRSSTEPPPRPTSRAEPPWSTARPGPIVAAMIGLQFQRLPIPVGDEAVIAVGGEESQLRTGRRLHPPDNEPHRRGVRLGLEGGVGGLGHIGGAVHPVRNRRPGIFGYRLDEIVQAFVLADGDGEARNGLRWHDDFDFDRQAADVRELKGMGLRQSTIGKAMGLSQARVSQILSQGRV